MRSMHVGIGASQETVMTVTLAGAGTSAILRIGQGEPDRAIAPPQVAGEWTVTLAPGDYLVTLDSEALPHRDNPVWLKTSAPVSFLSARAQPGAVKRSLVAWSGSELVADDPDDPWPRPPVTPTLAAAPATLLDRSPIREAMLTLIDASSGGAATGALHALLVGIDAYPRGPGPDGAIYRDLGGCVRDALEVEKFLRHEVQVPRERITRLLAATSDSDVAIAAAGTPRPTYAAIVRAWLTIIESARPGDVMYVHYAGHGGRARTAFPAIKRDGFDESIAPCDINDRQAGKYLRDVEIAALLARSAEKGVLTTLVLDCCHSGSATRGGEAQARRGDRDDAAARADALTTSLVASRAALDDIARELEHGPRGLEITWRVDQHGESSLNTVIAACRKHESAYEYDVDERKRVAGGGDPDGSAGGAGVLPRGGDGVHRRGALTYFWLDALRMRHPAMTYRDAYRRVFAGVQGVFAAQSPLLIGASDRLVLGQARMPRAGAIPVVGVDRDRITLGAGESGLLQPGTRLAIVPREAVPELIELSQMPRAEVTRVHDTSSTARILAFGDDHGEVAVGSQAVIVSFAPRLQRNVRLLDEYQTPASIAAFAALAQEIVREPTQLLTVDPENTADYQVAIDRSLGTSALAFSILDPAGHALPHLSPDLLIASRDAARRAKDRLVHLARYSNVLNLSNDDPHSPLGNKLGLTLHADVAGSCSPHALPERPTLKAGTHFWVRLENRSTRPVMATMFDLTSDYRIELIAQTWDLGPGEVKEVRMRAALRPGHRAIRDVLKVIATRAVVSFDWMTLPALEAPVTRGDVPRRAPANPFEAMMKAMQVPRRVARSLEVASAPTRDWAEARVTLDVVT